MNILHLDRLCISNATIAPTGYILSNSLVVVVWANQTQQRNFANIDFAREAYPNLVVLTH